jgi:2-dehydro-3-deoxy-D-arabinonate dehydratase
MKLIQFFLPGKGKRVGLVQGDRVLDITSTEEGVRSTLDLVAQGKTAQGLVARATWLSRTLHRKGLDWRELLRPPSRRVSHLLIPIDPPEVWGATDTYASAAEGGFIPASGSSNDSPATAPGSSGRPGLFFKATAARTVGPSVPIAIRSDSMLTVPEAGLAAILGTDGAVAAFTGGNDVTARDLERCGPEFQSQARIYTGSCALGPCLVTPDEIGDPRGLQIRCSIIRDGQILFSEATNTARLRQPVTETMAWLCRDNPVPAGTVLLTGTGIPVPDSAALADGDLVEIEIEGVGRLSNPVGRGATAKRQGSAFRGSVEDASSRPESSSGHA